MWRSFALGLGLAAAPMAPLAAQAGGPAPVTVDEAIEKERQVYGPPAAKAKPADDCAAAQAASPDEIVVCARKPADNSRYRVKSTAQLDSRSHQNLYDGLPRGPDVSGLPDCSSGCIRMGRTPPPIHLIDLSKIPEAPPGSDADRIAKGEKAAP
jgi:hypothetical protein